MELLKNFTLLSTLVNMLKKSPITTLSVLLFVSLSANVFFAAIFAYGNGNKNPLHLSSSFDENSKIELEKVKNAERNFHADSLQIETYLKSLEDFYKFHKENSMSNK